MSGTERNELRRVICVLEGLHVDHIGVAALIDQAVYILSNALEQARAVDHPGEDAHEL